MGLRELVKDPVSPLLESEVPLLLRMAAQAELCLRVNAGPGYEAYLAMDWLERRAWIVAAARLRGADAQRAGLAACGPLGAALSGADADGGAAAESVYLAQVTAEAVANIRAETEEALRVPQ